MGDAFCELIERLPADELPKVGGLNASIVVSIDFTGLKSGVGRAVLATGEPISASLARRMACEAGLIPAVLGSRSELLDLGRTARLFNGAQRLGLVVTQRVCTVLGCDWPAHLCHAHHDDSWFSGGETNFDEARLLCPRHHARIHDPRFETTIHPDNQVTFHMRT
ncbi:HNH endonuclease signature motif containing protein [Nocardioides deserti]|uniref:HNH endonuclease signature motif containing protein n=1 Tax=Nocardioides deserti TaxID=1588644 RepID=UPI001E4A8644|nr:HNH endonuclease signature motif containing protein [Nocardioides deserti]